MLMDSEIPKRDQVAAGAFQTHGVGVQGAHAVLGEDLLLQMCQI